MSVIARLQMLDSRCLILDEMGDRTTESLHVELGQKSWIEEEKEDEGGLIHTAISVDHFAKTVQAKTPRERLLSYD